jgi:phytoene synthase
MTTLTEGRGLSSMSTALVRAADDDNPSAVSIARVTIAKHSKSFALASKLLDARTRDQTAVVYTWCRRADDAIDECEPRYARPAKLLEGEPSGSHTIDVRRADAQAALARLRDELSAACADHPTGAANDRAAFANRVTDAASVRVGAALANRATDATTRRVGDTHAIARGFDTAGALDPVLAAFGDVARERAIPILYPSELLAGMAMDVAGKRYTTMDDLRLYCWRVAGVVGLMMTHVFGIDDDRALVHAAHLGIGMQLTNICRDVAEDWQRGRLYLPDELLARHGAQGLAGELDHVDAAELAAQRDARSIPASAIDPIRHSVCELLGIADRYYASGDRGLRALPWRAALAVKSASNVYRAIGTHIRARDCDVTAGRAVVSTSGKLARVMAAAARIAFMRNARAARAPSRTLEIGDVPEP